jgi:hypothetical protein
MKSIKYIISVSILMFGFAFPLAQIGVNTTTPNATLDIAPDDYENPSFDSGVIIPRVTTLNQLDSKEIGLLVFLDSTNSQEKGFYWWDGADWQPFISTLQLSQSLSLTYVGAEQSFVGGNIPYDEEFGKRTQKFNQIVSNDADNFEISADGELVILKKGYYHVAATGYYKKISGNQSSRDILDMKILVNGMNAGEGTADNFNLEGTKSFPTNGLQSITINATSTLWLDAGDKLSIEVERSYRSNNPANGVVLGPDPNSISNLSLRYLGTF